MGLSDILTSILRPCTNVPKSPDPPGSPNKVMDLKKAGSKTGARQVGGSGTYRMLLCDAQSVARGVHWLHGGMGTAVWLPLGSHPAWLLVKCTNHYN